MATKATEEQKTVLAKAREFYGRSWRNDIHFAWLTGNYKGIDANIASALQRIRNDPDRDWAVEKVRI